MGTLADLGSMYSGTGSAMSGASSLLGTLFGSGTSGSQTTSGKQTSTFDSRVTGTKTGTDKKYLDISDEGVDKIIADILGGTGGLAEIFSEQGAAGLYDSSVAAQASGDLVSKLAGEIAKLTAKEVTEYDTEEVAAKTGQDIVETVSKTKSKSKKKGLFG
jgi:hypothetical protein